MLIVIDIGNTNITMGAYDDDKMIGTYRLTTKLERTSDEYGFNLRNFLAASKIKEEDIEDVIIASVVPKINHSFTNSIIKYLNKEPLIVGSGTKSGIKIKIDDPKSLGADRLVDAVAAHNLYQDDCLVIDFGTATTFDIVTKDGEYLGGVTAPGVGITSEALSSKAAKLPEIEIKKPKNIIAKNTIDSMQAGVVYGYIGLSEYIIKKIKKEYKKPLRVISTGGLGRIIYNETDLIEKHIPDLTFIGLKLIYEKTKKD